MITKSSDILVSLNSRMYPGGNGICDVIISECIRVFISTQPPLPIPLRLAANARLYSSFSTFFVAFSPFPLVIFFDDLLFPFPASSSIHPLLFKTLSL